MREFPNLDNQVAGSDDRSKSIVGINAKIMDVHDRKLREVIVSINNTFNYACIVIAHADGDPTVERAVADLIGKLGRVAFPPVCDTNVDLDDTSTSLLTFRTIQSIAKIRYGKESW